MPRMAILKIPYFVMACLSMAGCAVGPDFKAPPPPKTISYTEAPQPEKTVSTPIHGGNAQAFMINQAIPLQWWGLFHCEALNQLIVKGLNNSPTMQAGQAALRQAQENFKAQVGTYLFPTFDLQGIAQRERFSGAAFGAENVKPVTFNLFNTQVNVGYTFDIFGGSRRALEALCAQVNYQSYELEGTYLTLAANIATTAITEASLHEQLKATKDILTIEENLLTIIKKQYELGGVSRTDVLTQETQVAQTRATLPPLEKTLAQTRHSLAVLVGELPSEAQVPAFSLDSLQLPAELPLSLPSNLVKQRPDIRASEALLHQASAQIGVATAALLPQFTLYSTFYGWESDMLSNLISPRNNIWSLAVQGLQPLFHGGALLAKRRGAIAAFDQAYAQYRQTVLQAFQNVADSLRAIELDAKTLQAQFEAESSAKNLLHLSKEQYSLGAINYLTLLNAQRQYQQALINRIQAQTARFTDTTALFQALGGAWWQAYPSGDLHG